LGVIIIRELTIGEKSNGSRKVLGLRKTKIHTSLTHFGMKNSKFAKLGGFIVNAARV
jgi:hypothetical protein